MNNDTFYKITFSFLKFIKSNVQKGVGVGGKVEGLLNAQVLLHWYWMDHTSCLLFLQLYGSDYITAMISCVKNIILTF